MDTWEMYDHAARSDNPEMSFKLIRSYIRLLKTTLDGLRSPWLPHVEAKSQQYSLLLLKAPDGPGHWKSRTL